MSLLLQRKITIVLLVLYWPMLFILGHIPVPQVVREADVSDKSLHFLAYLILVFLLWFAISGDKKVDWRKAAVWWVLSIIVVYGILDELLQSCVAGRSCDIRDFFADLAGILTGLILFSFFTFWLAGLLVAATVIFGITNIARANLADLVPVTNAAFHLFSYAIFTMLWIQYMRLFLPTKAPRAKWLILALAVPTGFLLIVKLFSVIVCKDLALSDTIVSFGAIAAVVTAFCLRSSFRKTQGAENGNFEP